MRLPKSQTVVCVIYVEQFSVIPENIDIILFLLITEKIRQGGGNYK